MMFAELRDLLSAVPTRSPLPGDNLPSQGRLFAAAPAPEQGTLFSPRLPSRDDYVHAVLDDNVLGKDTAAARRTSLQRLTELHAVDPAVAIFRVLRRLWEDDRDGRPLLTLLSALARDPLLRATAVVVLPMPIGSELTRTSLVDVLTNAATQDAAQHDSVAAPTRFNPAVLDKVARNAASSWAQSGHLEGRVRKLRRRVQPTPASAAFALWLGTREGLAGEYILRTLWAAALDVTPDELFDLALAAKQRGLVRAVSGGGVREIDVTGLDPVKERWR